MLGGGREYWRMRDALECDKRIDFMKSKLLINYYKHKFVHVISGVAGYFHSNGRKKDT